ncbi:hypothetical protein JCM11641_005747 [Rhodosporidiobolus odoratus]
MQPYAPIAPTSSSSINSSAPDSTKAFGTKRAADSSARGTSQTPETGAATKKSRQRQALSCQECRRLKLKCDRTWPCSSCRKRGCSDICPTGVSKPPGKAVRVAAEFGALLRRVDELESLVRDLGGAARIPPALNLEEATKRSTTVTKDLEREIEGKREEDSGEEYEGREQEEEDVKPDDEALRSVLVGVGSLSIGESGRTRFLGPAAGSAYYFEDDDPATASSADGGSVLEEDPLAADQIARYPFIQLGSLYPKASEIERLRTFLPPTEEAKRLSDNYWNYLSFQFTPVSAADFWNDYFPSAYTPHAPHPSKLACVYVILSLGAVFDPSAPSTPNPTAHTYFTLSQTVLSASRFLANSTLAAIQTLQLSANYLLNYHDLREGGESFFPVLGMAMRMLVVQGLQRDGESFGLAGEELNRRRRVFWELVTLERMQAFISGRPYTLSNAHFDTKMPEDADAYQTAKWKLGLLIGKVIDGAFSVATPSYKTILDLDQDLRNLVQSFPPAIRSGALPQDALIGKPTSIPQLPLPPNQPEKGLVTRMREYTLDAMSSQVLFYLHKPGFAQALSQSPEEPLKSPWAASVAAVVLESSVFLLALAKSWTRLHPVASRWWHIYFHSVSASVAQASLVIKSPKSVLAPHAWRQLNEACEVFEVAGAEGAPVAAFVPRLRTLREKAYVSLTNTISVPLGLGVPSPISTTEEDAADASLSILGAPTRLERKQKRRTPSANGLVNTSLTSVSSGHGSSPAANPSSSPSSPFNTSPAPSADLNPVAAFPSPSTALAEMLTATSALSAHAPPVSTTPAIAGPMELMPAQPYTPFDEPSPLQQNGSVSSASTTAQTSPAAFHPGLPPSLPLSLQDQATMAAYYQHLASVGAYPPYPHSYASQPHPQAQGEPTFPDGYRRPSTASETSPAFPPPSSSTLSLQAGNPAQHSAFDAFSAYTAAFPPLSHSTAPSTGAGLPFLSSSFSSYGRSQAHAGEQPSDFPLPLPHPHPISPPQDSLSTLYPSSTSASFSPSPTTSSLSHHRRSTKSSTSQPGRGNAPSPFEMGMGMGMGMQGFAGSPLPFRSGTGNDVDGGKEGRGDENGMDRDESDWDGWAWINALSAGGAGMASPLETGEWGHQGGGGRRRGEARGT